jgi:hypothetical protein
MIIKYIKHWMWTFCIFFLYIQPAQFDYVILHISFQAFHRTNSSVIFCRCLGFIFRKPMIFLPLFWINHQKTNDMSILSEIYLR